METLTFTAQEVNSLIKYIETIPTAYGRTLVNFFEKKIQDAQAKDNTKEDNSAAKLKAEPSTVTAAEAVN